MVFFNRHTRLASERPGLRHDYCICIDQINAVSFVFPRKKSLPFREKLPLLRAALPQTPLLGNAVNCVKLVFLVEQHNQFSPQDGNAGCLDLAWGHRAGDKTPPTFYEKAHFVKTESSQ
jgi:hypothetical protein